MCKFNLTLTSFPEGVAVSLGELTCVQYLPEPPLYVYEWKLHPEQVTQATRYLTQCVQDRTDTCGTDYMPKDRLHCTAHMHFGRDGRFKHTHTREHLVLQTMYWSKNVCACKVKLSE